MPRSYTIGFGALVLEQVRDQGYSMQSATPKLKGTDAGLAAALATACAEADAKQRRRRDELRTLADRLLKDLEDEHDPGTAERYAKAARELRDLEQEIGR